MLNKLWPFVSRKQYENLRRTLLNTQDKLLEAEKSREEWKKISKTQTESALKLNEKYTKFRDHILKFYGKDALQKRDKGRFTGEIF